MYIHAPHPLPLFGLQQILSRSSQTKCQMSSNVNKSLQGCSTDAVSRSSKRSQSADQRRSSIFHFPKVRLQEESSGSLDQDLRNTSKLQPKCLLCYLSSSHRALATALLPLQATMPTKVGLKLLFVGSTRRQRSFPFHLLFYQRCHGSRRGMDVAALKFAIKE